MKILIQHRHSDSEISGVMTYINSILPSLEAKGHEVKLVSTYNTSWIDWIKIISWSDVVHMNSNHLAFALACKILGKKIVIKYHYLFYSTTHSHYQSLPLSERFKAELKSYIPQANYPLKWKLFAFVKLARLATRMTTAWMADKHLACSQFLAESLAFPKSVDTLYNPIKTEVRLERKKVDDLEKPYTFIFLGRLMKDKGVDILISAAYYLQKLEKEFQIIILGEGSELDRCNF